MNSISNPNQSGNLLGHPTGLFTLFFAEMWERFSYYGMRALLVFYMIKGFLGYGDNDAYAVYGAYTALVYATPFIGGMLADRLLGARRAVVLGGLLMAAGHLTMTVQNESVFFIALALLICGNGFFKPNISTIVGSLYPKGSAKKDAGFTIFYMGINLGAAMSPVICGYVGETFGWHYGFGLATVGMLVGVAVFVAPTRLTQTLILGGALATGIAMLFLQDSLLQLAVRAFLSLSLVVGGVIAFMALGRGGLPDDAGSAPSDERLSLPAFPALRENAITYYLAIIASILALSQVASPSSAEAGMLACAAAAAILLPWVSARNAIYVCVAAAIPIIALLVRRSEVAGYLLVGFGVVAFGSLVREAVRSSKIERERMYVVLILMFFSMLFWAFFEQAGSSVNNFTDRNIDRVFEERQVTQADVGSKIEFRIPSRPNDERLAELPLLTQEQLGMPCDDELLVRVERAKARREAENVHEGQQAKVDQEQQSRIATALEALVKQNQDSEQDELKRPESQTQVSVTVDPASVPEDSGRSLIYTFKRTGSIKEPLRVSFDVSGTAEFVSDVEESDYTQTGTSLFQTDSGTITISAGESAAAVTITPKRDTSMEEDETVILTVTAGAGSVPADSKPASGTIQNDDRFFTMTHLTILRDEAARKDATQQDMTVMWTITEDHVGMAIGGAEVPASEFQAANPIYILVFGLLFTAIWSVLDRLGLEPSTPIKFALGLLQLGLAFGVFWYGAHLADERGMVGMTWLLLGYLLQTTGELCLSPVGLAMVTKLSPTRIVSTVMGAWFLATAFSNYLAGIIATFTGVPHGANGANVVPIPSETVHVYGDVFGRIAVAAIISAVICFILSPVLSRWMHAEVVDESVE